MREVIKIVVEPCKDGSGDWYWAVKIDGGVYADGEEGSEADARRKAEATRRQMDEDEANPSCHGWHATGN